MTAAKLVDLVAPPMSGDLHPILGIARRLAQEEGLEVRVISIPRAVMPEGRQGDVGIKAGDSGYRVDLVLGQGSGTMNRLLDAG